MFSLWPMWSEKSILFADSDVIVHGYIKKLGGPFTSAFQTRYGKLYPSRLELYPENLSGKPEVSRALRNRRKGGGGKAETESKKKIET